MAKESKLQNPHDKLFKATFSDPVEARSFLQAYLPQPLVDSLDWATLTLLKGSYIDDALKDSESDLVFHVKTNASKSAEDASLIQDVLLYLLFEHQSSTDKWMRFRLLKYQDRIWDESFKAKANPTILIPIIPIVFYQGKEPWNYSTQFSELFVEQKKELHEKQRNALAPYRRFIPDFEHILIDHSMIQPEAIKGEIKAKITQLLMWAAHHEPIQLALEIAARLLARLPSDGGLDYMQIYITYLNDTQDKPIIHKMTKLMYTHAEKIGGSTVNAKEAFRIDGEVIGTMKTEIKMTVETVDRMLGFNTPWEMITQFTEVDEQKYHLMKKLYIDFFAEPEKDDTAQMSRLRQTVIDVLEYRFQTPDTQKREILEMLRTFRYDYLLRWLIATAQVETLQDFLIDLFDFVEIERMHILQETSDSQ